MLARMNRYSGLLALVVVALVLCSCAPVFSIHSLYSDTDSYFDPGLVGTWFDPTDPAQSPIIFAPLGSNAYTVSGSDDSVKPPIEYTYECHLVKFGGRLFIDAEQSDISVANESVPVMAIPAHMLGELTVDQQNLTIRFLGYDLMGDSSNSAFIAIRHETTDDGLPILTANSADLQKFLLAHADDVKAFPVVVGPWRRKK